MVVTMASGTTSFYWLAIIALAIALAGSFLSKFRRGNRNDAGPVGDSAWPVRINENFITPAERSFLNVLKIVCSDLYVICPKVRLGDVVTTQKGTDSKLRQSIQNRINQKHLDFLLLDVKTMSPVMAIELDDKSHQTTTVQNRDLVKDKALKDAGLQIIRLPARATYTTSEIAAAISGTTAEPDSPEAQAETAPEAEANPSAPQPQTVLCPKCNTPMIIRHASKGTKAGTSFYGCANYPRCRETLPIIINSQEKL